MGENLKEKENDAEMPVVVDTKKQEKQVKIAVVFMAVLLLSVIFGYYIIGGINKFRYHGLDFKKVKIGEDQRFFTGFAVRDLTGKTVFTLPFYFRNDPRSLERIGISDDIFLKRTNAIAADTGFIEGCNESVYSAAKLSIEFLGNLGINSFPASINKTDAILQNTTYVDCNAAAPFSIISYEFGERSVIVKDGNCYRLIVANCEVVNVTERFIMGYYDSTKKL